MMESSSSSSAVKVVVRMRPAATLTKKPSAASYSIKNDQQSIVTIANNHRQISLKVKDNLIRSFTFDGCFDGGSTQEEIYAEVGRQQLKHSIDGYNTCIFAYGQTGSGKTFTMMGNKENLGVIPRLSKDLFEEIKALKEANPSTNYSTTASFLEIYNEKVKDLLNSQNTKLKIREHPSLGIYVENLTVQQVHSVEDILEVIELGSENRTVAATNMNDVSSRSHGIFSITLVQSQEDLDTGIKCEKISKICLVDLAGSERADSTGNTGLRLKEGSNINKSLTTLGKVIAKLSDKATTTSSTSSTSKNHSPSKQPVHVPYRDSVLTWLLKDNLGGNSKTIMLANISPAKENADETASTLRYAERAKLIQNKAVVNEDTNARLIKELKDEVELLRARVKQFETVSSTPAVSASTSNFPPVAPAPPVPPLSPPPSDVTNKEVDMLKERLIKSEKLMKDMIKAYEMKLVKLSLPALRTSRSSSSMQKRNKDLSSTSIESSKITTHYHTAGVAEGHGDVMSDGDSESKSLDQESILANTTAGGGDTSTTPSSFDEDEEGGQDSDSDPFKEILEIEEIILNEKSMLRNLEDNILSASVVGDSESNNGGINSEDDGLSKSYSSTSSALVSSIQSRRQSSHPQFPSSTTITTIENSEAASEAMSSLLESIRNREKDIENLQSLLKQKRVLLQSGAIKEYLGTPVKRRQVDGRRIQQIVKEVAERLRSRKFVSLARDLLSKACLLKEANILSMELKCGMAFESCIIDPKSEFNSDTLSVWEREAEALSPGEESGLVLPAETSSSEGCSPFVGVRVYDVSRNSIYYWTLSQLESCLFQARKVYHRSSENDSSSSKPSQTILGDNDQQTQQQQRLLFEIEGEEAPAYVFMGSAFLSLEHVSQVKPGGTSIQLPVVHNGKTIGQIRLTAALHFTNSADESSTASSSSSSGEYYFKIRNVDLNGIDEDEFTDVHFQIRFKEDEQGSNERVMAARPVFGFDGKDIKFNFTGRIPLTRLLAMNEKYLSIQIFGRLVRPVSDTVRVMFSESNNSRKTSTINRRRTSPSSSCYYLWSEPRLSTIRAPSSHCVMAKMQILELTHTTGEFKAVPSFYANRNTSSLLSSIGSSTNNTTFMIRQGLQRRIQLNLSHRDGTSLPWTRISKMEIGNITKMSASDSSNSSASFFNQKKAAVAGVQKNTDPLSQHADVYIPLGPLFRQSVVIDEETGLSSIDITLSWDSSQHESPLLNMITNIKRDVIQLSLIWEVEYEDGMDQDETMSIISSSSPTERINPKSQSVFRLDFNVSVYDRESKVKALTAAHSTLYSLLSGFGVGVEQPKYSKHASSIYSVELVKETKRQHHFTIDTRHQYVRGEEILKGWKSHGLELLFDYFEKKRLIEQSRLVELNRQAFVALVPNYSLSSSNVSLNNNIVDDNNSSSLDLLDKFLKLWKMKSSTTDQEMTLVDLSKLLQNALNLERKTINANASDTSWLVPVVKHQQLSGIAAKRGFLNSCTSSAVTSTSASSWVKRWVVVERPYISVFRDANEDERLAVIHLANASIQSSDELGAFTQKPHTFAIYTKFFNLFQASNQQDFASWMEALDPLGRSVIASSLRGGV